MSKRQLIIFSIMFLMVSILFASYSSILQISCWITGVGFVIKSLTIKENILK